MKLNTACTICLKRANRSLTNLSKITWLPCCAILYFCVDKKLKCKKVKLGDQLGKSRAGKLFRYFLVNFNQACPTASIQRNSDLTASRAVEESRSNNSQDHSTKISHRRQLFLQPRMTHVTNCALNRIWLADILDVGMLHSFLIRGYETIGVSVVGFVKFIIQLLEDYQSLITT